MRGLVEVYQVGGETLESEAIRFAQIFAEEMWQILYNVDSLTFHDTFRGRLNALIQVGLLFEVVECVMEDD